MPRDKRILLIDPSAPSREGLASRLQTLGYEVATANDGAQGAYQALEDPPHAVVADLFMPSISGAQLCRLLNAEPATADVPVILRGPEAHRNRFWAEQTGALAYVVKGRMGDLVRALTRGFEKSSMRESFFTAYSSDGNDVRDRIAHYLDAALFASVIAAEVRKLAACESFDTLFDHFAQFVSQVTNYRWLSVATDSPFRGGLHSRPGLTESASQEALEALNLPSNHQFVVITDDDASDDEDGPEALVRPILFGDTRLGALALGPRFDSYHQDVELIDILARELGGALRTATLVEESQRLARHDSLTSLFNRRAFSDESTRELERAKRHAHPISALLLDVDHFKRVNDTHGHATGDAVLSAVGGLLKRMCRSTDICARWGGEEFVVLLPDTNEQGAFDSAERLRAAIAALDLKNDRGDPLSVSASFGVTTQRPADTLESFLDRADKAMYLAKGSGRNRVCGATDSESKSPHAASSNDGDRDGDCDGDCDGDGDGERKHDAASFSVGTKGEVDTPDSAA